MIWSCCGTAADAVPPDPDVPIVPADPVPVVPAAPVVDPVPVALDPVPVALDPVPVALDPVPDTLEPVAPIEPAGFAERAAPAAGPTTPTISTREFA